MSIDCNVSCFEDVLKEKGCLIYTNVGTSMLPLIRQRKDILVIERPKEWDNLADKGVNKLKRFDVALYKRDNGNYVLHRVLKVRKDDYVICGDNRCVMEDGICDRHIIGVLKAIVRNGKEIKVTSLKYKIYVFIWCRFYIVRFFIIRVINKLRRMRNGVFRGKK